MRKPFAVLVATTLVGYAVLAAVAGGDGRRLAATLPVPSDGSSGYLAPGARVCEPAVVLPFAADAAQLTVVSGREPGPPLVVSVRSATTGRTLASGRLPGGYRLKGYPDRPVQTVPLARIDPGVRVGVCIANAGATRAALYAGRGQTARRDHGISLVALHASRRNALSLVPEIFARAARFKAGWVRPWLFWLLALGAVIGVPALLVAALSAAASSPSPGPRPRVSEDPEQVRDEAERRTAVIAPRQ